MHRIKKRSERLNAIKEILNGTRSIESILPKSFTVWFTGLDEEPPDPKPSWWDSIPKIELVSDSRDEPIKEYSQEEKVSKQSIFPKRNKKPKIKTEVFDEAIQAEEKINERQVFSKRYTEEERRNDEFQEQSQQVKEITFTMNNYVRGMLGR